MSTTRAHLSTTNRLPTNELVLELGTMSLSSPGIQNPVEDTKSGQKVAKWEKSLAPDDAQTGPSRKPAKTHQDYWSSRVFLPGYSINGKSKTSSLYCIRHQFSGRRELFTLDTAVQATAARKARDIWMSLRTVGWDETLRKFKPRAVFTAPQFVTLHDYITFLEEQHLYTASALKRNLSKCYTLLAGMFEKDRPRSRYDARKKGLKDWHDKLRAIRLDQLTPQRLELFRASYLAAREVNPVRHIAAKHTVDGYLRAAKALFGPVIRKRLTDIGVTLPEPIPFASASYVSRGRSVYRYRSRMDPYALTATAIKELGGEFIEQLKIFLLALHLGLRRNEIDKLLWSQFDFERGVLRVEHTEFIQLKTEGGEGDLLLEPELVEFFRKLSETATGIFVIASPNAPRKVSGWDHYRANDHFRMLCAWLRAHGVNTQKPIHTLRKEFGRLITEKLGLFAASLALRHASTTVTAIYYADDRRPKHTGLGILLAPKPPETPVGQA